MCRGKSKFIQLFALVKTTINISFRRSFSRQITKLTKGIRDELKCILKDQSWLCATADIRSSKRRSYMGVSIHWIIKQTRKARMRRLAAFDLFGSHKYDKMGEKLDAI